MGSTVKRRNSAHWLWFFIHTYLFILGVNLIVLVQANSGKFAGGNYLRVNTRQLLLSSDFGMVLASGTRPISIGKHAPWPSFMTQISSCLKEWSLKVSIGFVQ